MKKEIADIKKGIRTDLAAGLSAGGAAARVEAFLREKGCDRELKRFKAYWKCYGAREALDLWIGK